MSRSGEKRMSGRCDAVQLAAARERLAAMLGDRLSDNPSTRAHHVDGEGYQSGAAPDLVAFPESNMEVAAIVRCCDDLRIPVIPFGAGTSLEGHLAALHGGVSLDLSRMNAVLDVDEGALDCRVQAGVARAQLDQHIRDRGLFFPLDPGADATLGGMAATRASGTNAVRYGTMSEVTLGLTVVTPRAEIIRTGGRARKSAAGYDLTRLFIGSEGTLGVITEVQLRLFGLPEVIATSACQFPDLGSAVNAVTAALQSNLQPARIELLDALQMRACIAYSKLSGFEGKPTLFLEFHGGPKAVEEQVARMREISDAHGERICRRVRLRRSKSGLDGAAQRLLC